MCNRRRRFIRQSQYKFANDTSFHCRRRPKMTEVSLTNLGKKVKLTSGKTITLGPTGAIPFANQLTNCTPHPIDIEITNSSGKKQLVPISPDQQPLLLETEHQGRIRTLSLAYFSDDDDENEQEQELDDTPLIKRQKPNETITNINVFDPQRFRGFKEPLPKISRSLCPGILVSMPVGLFLESLSEQQLDELIPADKTDVDEYDEDDELDQVPEKRRRVPIYGPDTAPESVVRNETGAIIGCSRLVAYKAVY